MSFLGLLRQSGRLDSGTVARSSTGQETVTWTTGSTYPVLVTLFSPSFRERPGVLEDVTHVVMCQVIADLLADPFKPWRWVVAGQEYRVVDVRDPGARGHHLECRARRVS